MIFIVYQNGLTAEMVAAVAKIMSNLDLIVGAQKITITKTANTTIGIPGTFQPVYNQIILLIMWMVSWLQLWKAYLWELEMQ